MNKLEQMKEEYAALGAKIEAMEATRPWKPEKGQEYYSVEPNGNILAVKWADDNWFDNPSLERGNVFRTREAAERDGAIRLDRKKCQDMARAIS